MDNHKRVDGGEVGTMDMVMERKKPIPPRSRKRMSSWQVGLSVWRNLRRSSWMNKKKFIWFVLMIVVMIVVFIFSNQNGDMDIPASMNSISYLLVVVVQK